MFSSYFYYWSWTLSPLDDFEFQDLQEVRLETKKTSCDEIRDKQTTCVRFLSFGFTIAQRKDVQMTRILLTVVVVFLLLHLPRLILGIFEISRYQVWPDQGRRLTVQHCAGTEWLFTVFSPRPPTPCRSGRW